MCLALAMRLRAWVYPLLYMTVHDPEPLKPVLGAYAEDGEFVLNPSLSQMAISELTSEQQSVISSKKQAATAALASWKASYGMQYTKDIMNRRPVVIAGDIVTEPLPVAVALHITRSVQPKTITTVVGNASAISADYIRLTAERSVIRDVLTGPLHDDERYFEHHDGYDVAQSKELTKNIATYWQ